MTLAKPDSAGFRLPAAPRRRAAGLMLAGLMPLALVLLALLLSAGAARAELNFPTLTGRVVDAAGVLTPAQRQALDEQLAAQEAKASDQFVVATVPSLQGTSVEDYANRLFRFWKLGQAKEDNGVLLLVAPNERRVRIEVGYGLEGVLPDAVASTIIQTAIVPAFRGGDFAGGIARGAEAVIEVLNLDPEEAKARARAAAQKAGPELTGDDWETFLFGLLLVGFWLFIMWRQMRGGGGRRRIGRSAALPGGVSGWDWSRNRGGWSGGGGGSSGGGFSGGGGSSGGGGASGSW